MLTCKIIREISSGTIYKIVFPNAIKYIGISHDPMNISHSVGKDRGSGSFRISIKTVDRKEYHLTKDTFNYEAINMLSELIEVKLGLRKLKERHKVVLRELSREEQLFFTEVATETTMLHSEKLNDTLNKIDEIMPKK
ncbi:MAG: hypothetical protein R3Y29_07540 [bacterium]